MEIDSELLFLVKKVTISETSNIYSENLYFLSYFKWATPEKNLDLCKQLFLFKPVKGDKFNKNCFSPQSEAHTAKLCLSVVLNYILGKFLENFSF